MSLRKFIIDTGRCIGCNACSVACKDRAGLPDELDLLRVERVESGLYPDVNMFFRVVHCFHCEDPPCLEVCPSDAISKNENGFVLLDVEKCIGCGSCSDVCPFESVIELSNGLFMKCDGCYDEVALGWDPTCVRACLTRALSFTLVDNYEALDWIDGSFDGHGVRPAVIYQEKRKFSKS